MIDYLLDYVRQIDWKAVVQWYWSHLDAGYLIHSWQFGRSFTLDEWLSFLLLWGHVLVIVALVYALVRTHRGEVFRQWLASRRSQLTRRPVSESRTQLEPKFTGLLKKAYNLHRLAMYEPALDKFKQAYHSSPNDLNTYLAGIKMVSEMDVPDSSFIQFMRDSFHYLREKHPRVWNEVARYGRQTAPNLDQWQAA